MRYLIFFTLLIALAGTSATASQAPAISAALQAALDRLGTVNYNNSDVVGGAEQYIHRLPASEAVPALTYTVLTATDQLVRSRSLVLLTGFSDPAIPPTMRTLMGDRSVRVREMTYRWMALHPDPSQASTLLELLQAEKTDGVRPAIAAALAAVDTDPQVRRTLLEEVNRGPDFFRVAVIDTLGRRRATYAADAIAEIAKVEGPLQDDAVLALARIGDPRATGTVAAEGNDGADVRAALLAARCLLDGDCTATTKALAAAALDAATAPQNAQAAVTALGAVAEKPDMDATSALLSLESKAPPAVSDQAAVELSILAVRSPLPVLAWLDGLADGPLRNAAIDVLRAGFDRLEQDFAEEQFYVAAHAAYVAAPQGSAARTRLGALLDALAF